MQLKKSIGNEKIVRLLYSKEDGHAGLHDVTHGNKDVQKVCCEAVHM